jgi:hypothetical protein
MSRKITVGVGLLLALGSASMSLAWLGRSEAVAQVPAAKAPALVRGKAYLFSSQSGWLRAVVTEEPRDNWVRVRAPVEQGREANQWINLGLILRVMEDTPGEADTGDVKGKVTIDGELVLKGKVIFYPEAGDPVEADIKNGSYSATDVPAGTVRVTVLGQTEKKESVPQRYADKERTPLRLRVRKGESTLDLTLAK